MPHDKIRLAFVYSCGVLFKFFNVMFIQVALWFKIFNVNGMRIEK